MALVVKNLSASAGDVRDVGSIPGSGRSPGEGHGNSLQYSCLENPMEPGGLQSIASHGVRHDWRDWACTHIHTRTSFYLNHIINVSYITRKGFLKYSIWRFVKLCNKRVPSIPFISFDCIMKGNSGKWNSFLSDLEKFSFLLFPFAIWSVWLVRSLNTHFSIWL